MEERANEPLSREGEAATLPDWRDEKWGLRVRLALFLVSQVGEGNTFTLAQLREAFPGHSEIGRRLRDLRPGGWGIEGPRDDRSLRPDEYRLVKIGSPVWEKAHRSDGLRMISASVRHQVLLRDGYRCAACGVLAGEPYAEDPTSQAHLTVQHITPIMHGGGTDASNLITLCSLCNVAVGSAPPVASAEEAWSRAVSLSPKDQARLLAWLIRGRREASPLESAASAIFRLPPGERAEILGRLADHLAQ